MSGNLTHSRWPLLLAGLFAAWQTGIANCAGAEPPPEASRSAILHFLDGQQLHGALEGIEEGKGVRWKAALARSEVRFRTTNLSSIQFQKSLSFKNGGHTTSRVQFQNGDEVFGNVNSLDTNSVAVETWFGANLSAPRDALRSIMFSAKGFNVLYEGPSGKDGWFLGRSADPWEYKDGAFVSDGPDVLGRNFGLTNSASIGFDLAWNTTFNLSLTLYTDVIDRFDYGSQSYLFYIGAGSVSLQRIQPGAGAIMLGQAGLPVMYKKNQVRIEIRVNKEDSTIAFLVDGALVQKWKDNMGFAGKGGGMVFVSSMKGQQVRVSNIKVTEWDSRIETDSTNESSSDTIFLANKDKALGKVQTIKEGGLTFAVDETKLHVPLERVSQILFAGPGTNAVKAAANQVRALFSAGENVALQLTKWTQSNLEGMSPNFGLIKLESPAIRELHFNLDRTRKRESQTPTDPELMGFDE